MADSFSNDNFDKLLRLLDPRREAAGDRYEELRARLIRFFDWRGSSAADELADVVFDRIVRKIGEGEEIQNVAAYAATVAQFVYKESLRKPSGRNESLDDHPNIAETVAIADSKEDIDGSPRADCLDKCLAALGRETRELLIAYHDTDERTMIPTRRRLADQMEISLNTLRIRVCRHKSKLEDCVRDCCGET